MSDKKPPPTPEEAARLGLPLEEARVAADIGTRITEMLNDANLTLHQGWAILMAIVIGSIIEADAPPEKRRELGLSAARAFGKALQHAGLLPDDETLVREATKRLGMREAAREGTRPMRRSRNRWKS